MTPKTLPKLRNKSLKMLLTLTQNLLFSPADLQKIKKILFHKFTDANPTTYMTTNLTSALLWELSHALEENKRY